MTKEVIKNDVENFMKKVSRYSMSKFYMKKVMSKSLLYMKD